MRSKSLTPKPNACTIAGCLHQTQEFQGQLLKKNYLFYHISTSHWHNFYLLDLVIWAEINMFTCPHCPCSVLTTHKNLTTHLTNHNSNIHHTTNSSICTHHILGKKLQTILSSGQRPSISSITIAIWSYKLQGWYHVKNQWLQHRILPWSISHSHNWMQCSRIFLTRKSATHLGSRG